MNTDTQLPTALKVVAWLFIINGVLTALKMAAALFAGRIDIDFGVIEIPIGWGLLRLNRGWRTVALVFLVIALVGIPIIAIFVAFSSGGAFTISLFGLPIGATDKTVFLLVAAIAFAIVAWQFSVLNRKDVRDLFELETPD
jgi:hypothetical protein